MSSPSRMTCPPTMWPGGEGITRIIDSAVTDLPQPDSPTIPSVSPRLSEKLTPSTAFVVPHRVTKCVVRSRTSRTVSSVALFPTSPSGYCQRMWESYLASSQDATGPDATSSQYVATRQNQAPSEIPADL